MPTMLLRKQVCHSAHPHAQQFLWLEPVGQYHATGKRLPHQGQVHGWSLYGV
jgi:hypothetical protein